MEFNYSAKGLAFPQVSSKQPAGTTSIVPG